MQESIMEGRIIEGNGMQMKCHAGEFKCRVI